MTRIVPNRFAAFAFAAVIALASWTATLTVPADHNQLATAPVAVELA